MRLNPEVTVDKPSPNHSARSGQISLIVVHASEAPRLADDQDLKNLAAWFGKSSSQVSSHVATNGAGHSARFVPDSLKAWHVADYNSVALGIEQIGHTTDTHWPEAEVEETARWIAHWSKQHNIPIRAARVEAGRVLESGVARHSDLGREGGNHGDPGKGYPLHHCLELARDISHKL